MEDTVLVYEWDSDAFHRRVIELESAGYTSRQASSEDPARLPDREPPRPFSELLHCVKPRITCVVFRKE